MNTSSNAETKAPSSLKETFLKVIPDTIVGRILFWGALPIVLLLTTVAVTFLNPAPFSIYLPFLALVSSILCLKWRTIGLGGSFLALGLLLIATFKDIPAENKLWQMGILFTLSLDLFILLLALEEVDFLVGKLAEAGRVKGKELLQAQLQLQQFQDEWQTQQKSLQDEIEELKEEAEQRRIEKHQHIKEIELIRSEIELLTSQKTHFVEEGKKAREVLEKEAHSQQAFQELEVRLNEAEVSEVELKKQLTEVEAQLEEKTRQLQVLLKSQKEEVAQVEESLKISQQTIMKFQQAQTKVADATEVKKLEGMYRQLRMQFEEKARILSQTRKELFHTQGKLLAWEQEEKLTSQTAFLDETGFYENELNLLVKEVDCLEEEVRILEEIISNAETLIAT